MDNRVKKTVGKVAETIIDHTPEPIKDKVKEVAVDKAKEKITDTIQNKFHDLQENMEDAKVGFADKVHDKAGEAKGKTQQALLTAREKLGKVKEAGEGFQKKISSRDKDGEDQKVKGAKHLKGISHIKTSKDIKGASNIKSTNDIKTTGS